MTRFAIGEDDAGDFAAEAGGVLDVLSTRPGYLHGSIGRAIDEPSLWVLTTRWQSVGAYRRAIGSYDVKVTATPLLSRALDEPSAYEIVAGDGATTPNEARPRGDARA